MVEAQSTWTVNILIRALLYLGQTYNEYFIENKINLYGSEKVDLPKPEMYVLYTGDRKDKPDTINLKDEFFGGEEIAVNAEIKVLYDGRPGDIISQYVGFTKVLEEQVRIHGRTLEAIKATIEICKDKDLLKEYLESREKEVVGIMVTLFDEEEVMERYAISIANKAAINATIDECIFFGATKQQAVERLVDKFGLSSDVAGEMVQESWK